MDAFAQQIERWHDFYTLVGGAATTLVGLLFVSISLHLQTFVGARQRAMRAMADQAFSGFLAVLIAALFFLVPDQNASGLGWALCIIGGQGLVRNFLRARLATRSAAPAGRAVGVHPFWSFIGPSMCYAAMAVAGVFVGRGSIGALHWLVVVIGALIVIATGNSWSLLVLDDGSGTEG